MVTVRKFLHRLLKGSSLTTPIEVEQAEQIFYINYLRNGMIAFDVGANVGELTLLFSRFVGLSGQVHAFEPSSAVFNRLNTICNLAGRKNITLNHKALADKEGYVQLYVYDDEHSTWNSLAQRPLHDYGIDVKPTVVEEVPATTIDSYCQEHGIQKVDLLKVDVEGAEYQVLLGARSMLERKQIACCVFEFGATTFDMGNNPSEIQAYLTECGYQLQNIVRGDPVFPGRSNAKIAKFSVHIARPKR